MREDLKQIIDQLGEEDVYLLYVAALEMIQCKPQPVLAPVHHKLTASGQLDPK